MTAIELLADLRRRGVRLWVEGPDLRFSSPPGTMAGDTIERIRGHKSELMALLSSPAGPAPASAAALDAPPAPRSGPRRDDLVLDTLHLPPGAVAAWAQAQSSPYVRHVSPFKAFLYDRLGLARTFTGADGCHLIDAQGRRYTDFIAQYGAVPFGHDPGPVWDAVLALRAERRPNLTINAINEEAGRLAERLLALAPPGLAHVTLANSGAEAVEAALKLARVRTGRHGILAARNSYHGLTLGSLSATGRGFFQRGFGAPVAGFDYVDFADAAALETALARRPGFYAAFVVEPVQGESGIRTAPPGYLSAAQSICRRHGVLLIVDEVQTGLGRTGRLFACEHDGLTPDIMTLAKALGGGLVPIGALLYTAEAYSEAFDLRHGSTFAGGALACRAALATLELLTRDKGALIAHVRARGEQLRAGLADLQARFPALIVEVRGSGLMLGVELDFSSIGSDQAGLVACLQQHGLLLPIAVSYLLEAEAIRVAPSFTGGTVLRIEPPLIIGETDCARLIEALERTLASIARGDAGALLAHLMEAPRPAPSAGPTRKPATAVTPPPSPSSSRSTPAPRFAFVVHLMDAGDLARFDATLAPFTDDQIGRLRDRIAAFVEPFPIGHVAFAASEGRHALGELVLIPHTAAELLAMPGRDAVRLVQSAVDIAVDRGAGVVGLGGFSSIVCDGGLALATRPGLTLTSGNSLTTHAAVSGTAAACRARGLDAGSACVAVVGAAGSIGEALSLITAETCGELILIGNPTASEASLQRLRAVAEACAVHVRRRAAGGTLVVLGSVAERLLRGEPVERCIRLSTDLERDLPAADVIFAATNATRPFIESRHLRAAAIVSDVSRPFNVTAGLAVERPDVLVLRGGLVRAPAGTELGLLADEQQADCLVACAAETMLLAASGHRSTRLCGQVDAGEVHTLGALAAGLGLAVV